MLKIYSMSVKGIDLCSKILHLAILHTYNIAMEMSHFMQNVCKIMLNM